MEERRLTLMCPRQCSAHVREHCDPDQFQIAPRRTSKKKEKNANDEQDDSEVQESEAILPDDGPGWGEYSDDSATPADAIKTDVQSDSDTQERKSILPDDGPGWGSSSDSSLMPAVTIKTEPPDHVEQDKEPSSHLVSVKSEPECFEEVREPDSLVAALTKDYTNVTKVTFHFDAEPQVSEDTRRRYNTAVAVKIEPPDPTEVHTKAASTGTDVRHDFAARQSGTIPANARLGLCSESYPNGSEILRRILSRGKTDRALLDAGLDGSSANTVMTAVTIKTGPGAAPSQEVEQHRVLVDPTVAVWPPRHAPPAVCDGLQPQADVIKFRKEAVAPHEGKIQPEQFYELFLGGFDYVTTDSRATSGGEERSRSVW